MAWLASVIVQQKLNISDLLYSQDYAAAAAAAAVVVVMVIFVIVVWWRWWWLWCMKITVFSCIPVIITVAVRI
jgi:hypothetical protein